MLATVPARLFFLFSLSAIFSWIVLGARDPLGFGYSPVASYLSFLMLLFITYALIDNLEHLRWTLLAAIASSALASLYVIREWQKYGAERPGSVTGDSNYFAISVVLVFPLAVYLASGKYPKWQRFFCGGSLLVMTVAMMLAQSRGGFLALLAAGAMLIGKSKHWARYSIVVLLLLGSALLLAPVSPWERLVHPDRSDQESTDIRLSYWRTGGRMIEANPFFGVGLGNFKAAMPKYKVEGDVESVGVAHNMYVEIGTELGIPATILLLAFLLSTLHSLSRARKTLANSRKIPEMLKPLQIEFLYDTATGIQAGLVGALVSVMFVSGQTQKLFWLMLFLGLRITSFVPLSAASSAQDAASQPLAPDSSPYSPVAMTPSAHS